MFFVSNAPQVFEVLKFGGDQRMILNYIVLGGPVEFYSIMRAKPEDIISKFHTIIGYSAMPPYHALGFYQGSNTYDSLAKVQSVVQGYTDPGVALEGVFISNYNKQPHQTFTISDNFKGI
jgi:alpha-glucosidase (family GH31 glycosyl hydrolase)